MNDQIMDIVTIHVRMCSEVAKIKNKLKENNHTFKTNKRMVAPRESIYELHITNDDTNISWIHTTCYLFNDIFNNGYKPIKISNDYTLGNFISDIGRLEKTLNNIINRGYFGKYTIIDDYVDIFITIRNARNYAHLLAQSIIEYVKDYNVSEEDE